MLAWTRSIPPIGLSPCAILLVTPRNRMSIKNVAHFSVVLHRECRESVTGFLAVDARWRIVKIFELAFLLEVTPPTSAALQLVFRSLVTDHSVWRRRHASCPQRGCGPLSSRAQSSVAPHATVGRCTCHRNGGPDILLLGMLPSNARRGEAAWTPLAYSAPTWPALPKPRS